MIIHTRNTAVTQPGYPACTAHLAVLQRHQTRVVGCTDDLIVPLVCRGAKAGGDVVSGQTLCVADSIILPRLEVHSVQRSLQNPVTGSWRVGCFNDDVSYLEDLQEEQTDVWSCRASFKYLDCWDLLQRRPR